MWGPPRAVKAMPVTAPVGKTYFVMDKINYISFYMLMLILI